MQWLQRRPNVCAMVPILVRCPLHAEVQVSSGHTRLLGALLDHQDCSSGNASANARAFCTWSHQLSLPCSDMGWVSRWAIHMGNCQLATEQSVPAGHNSPLLYTIHISEPALITHVTYNRNVAPNPDETGAIRLGIRRWGVAPPCLRAIEQKHCLQTRCQHRKTVQQILQLLHKLSGVCTPSHCFDPPIESNQIKSIKTALCDSLGQIDNPRQTPAVVATRSAQPCTAAVIALPAACRRLSATAGWASRPPRTRRCRPRQTRSAALPAGPAPPGWPPRTPP